jgi:hypothetical protein
MTPIARQDRERRRLWWGGVIVAVLLVLLVIAWAVGWFEDAAPPEAVPTPTTTQ